MNQPLNVPETLVPPGFRFHPTEEELLHYYLRKKIAFEKIDLDVIKDVDLNKLEPWDIQEKCRIGSTAQNDWYFFSHKDKKYPTGTRTNRATAAGFWKATGRDKVIYTNSKRIGMRKTLVFYRGRAPHGQKTDWIMHEYRLDDLPDSPIQHNIVGVGGPELSQEEGWVVCRVFKKKEQHHKQEGSPVGPSAIKKTNIAGFDSGPEGALGEILQYMTRPISKQETENMPMQPPPESQPCKQQFPDIEHLFQRSFNYLSEIETISSATSATISATERHVALIKDHADCIDLVAAYSDQGLTADWGSLDRLVGSHLNNDSEAEEQNSKDQIGCFNSETPSFMLCQTPEFDLRCLQQNTRLFNSNNSDSIGLWCFERSSSDSGFLSSTIV